MKLTLEELTAKPEGQTFERKSVRKEAKGLSNHMVAFANADGGVLAIGIEDDGTISGINDYPNQVSEILRVSYDFCRPSVPVTTELIDCIDKNGKPNKVLIINVEQSSKMHANQQDEVYYRLGDKTRKLNFEERMQLMYAKGSRYFEDEPVYKAGIDDIDWEFVEEYCKKIGYSRTPQDFIRSNGYLISHDGREELSAAAVLLFGKNPQKFFPRAQVRFIRYEGTEIRTGKEMNIIKDFIIDGKILDMVAGSLSYVKSQIKEYTRLWDDCRFHTTSEYPEFVWQEIIINAIAHRDYSILGTDIQIRMFDDRITVESPGILSGMVRINNLRSVHYSRNPKIARFLHEYEYVKEFGEGIDRMFNEMDAGNLPAPEFHENSFMFEVTVRNGKSLNDKEEKTGKINNVKHENEVGANYESDFDAVPGFSKYELMIYGLMTGNPQITVEQLAQTLHLPQRTAAHSVNNLLAKGIVKRIGNEQDGWWKISN